MISQQKFNDAKFNTSMHDAKHAWSSLKQNQTVIYAIEQMSQVHIQVLLHTKGNVV